MIISPAEIIRIKEKLFNHAVTPIDPNFQKVAWIGITHFISQSGIAPLLNRGRGADALEPWGKILSEGGTPNQTDPTYEGQQQ